MSEYTGPQNPLLLPAGENPSRLTVPPIQGHTPAYPVALKKEMNYYVCSLPNHNMHRKDGKKLAFIHNVLATQDLYDIAYVEDEIANGNPHITQANQAQVTEYKMRTNPRGAITEELRPKLEEEIRDEFDMKLRTLGVQLTDEQRAVLYNNPGTKVESQLSVTDAEKILGSTGVDTLAKKEEPIRTGTGVLEAMRNMASTSFQSAVVGSDKTVNSAESNQASQK